MALRITFGFFAHLTNLLANLLGVRHNGFTGTAMDAGQTRTEDQMASKQNNQKAIEQASARLTRCEGELRAAQARFLMIDENDPDRAWFARNVENCRDDVNDARFDLAVARRAR